MAKNALGTVQSYAWAKTRAAKPRPTAFFNSSFEKTLFTREKTLSTRRSSSPHTRIANMRLLLLRALDLVDLLHDLAKHDDTVAVKEGDAGETLAVLEGVDDQGLLRGEVHLCHLVGLERVRVLHLLAAGLLADLPVHLGDAAGRAPAADEADRRVADLDLARDVEDLDLGVEVVAGAERGVLLVHHDVARAGHVLLVETLDVHADVVTRAPH